MFVSVFCMVRATNEESLGWNPNDLYVGFDSDEDRSSKRSAFTEATMSDSYSSDAVLPSLGGRVSFFTPSSRARFSYAPVYYSPTYTPSITHQSNGGATLYTTSSAEYRSFGGGGNGGAATGGSMRGSSSPVALSPSIAFSPNSLVAYSPSNDVTAEQDKAAIDQMAVMAAPAYRSSFSSGYAMNTLYGTTLYDASPAYSDNTNPYRVGGRQNAATGIVSSWEEWLAGWLAVNGNSTNPDLNGNGVVDDEEVKSFMTYIEQYWNDDMSGLPDEADIREFLNYSLPVGDVLPLLMLALLYMVILFVKRNKTAQL